MRTVGTFAPLGSVSRTAVETPPLPKIFGMLIMRRVKMWGVVINACCGELRSRVGKESVTRFWGFVMVYQIMDIGLAHYKRQE